MNKRPFMLFIILVLLLFSSYCYSAEVTVSTSAEFQIALDSADLNREDDIITLLPGTYSGSDVSFLYEPKSEDENLTIRGSGEVLLDGEGQEGQILYIFSPWPADITLQGLTFQNSVRFPGYGGGGAAFIQINAGNINVVECSFKDNEVPDSRGGGLYALISKNGTINITNCDFTGNVASGHGGGLYAEIDGIGGINLEDNSFLENSSTAGFGGAAYIDVIDGNCLITGNTFSDNSARLSSGGIRCYVQEEGDLYFADNFLDGNIVSDDPYEGGGACLGCRSGDLTVENCSFTNNISPSDGGGVCTYFYSGDFLFRNNLVADNFSIESGGGAYLLFHVAGTNPFDIINNTITGNTVSEEGYSGGGLYIDSGANNVVYSIYNNIIWGNSASDGSDIYFNDRGRMNSFSLYNNDFSVLSTDFTGGSVISEDLNLDFDPMFVSATDYHLKAGSPLIDEGDSFAPSLSEIDLDGNARKQGVAVDMGAYEDRSGGSSGGCSTSTFIPSMLLLIAPLLFLARKSKL